MYTTIVKGFAVDTAGIFTCECLLSTVRLKVHSRSVFMYSVLCCACVVDLYYVCFPGDHIHAQQSILLDPN